MNKLRMCTIPSFIALAIPMTIFAAETVVYKYDARGRLIKVERSGTVNSNVKTEFTHDKADNRKVKKTSGASGP